MSLFGDYLKKKNDALKDESQSLPSTVETCPESKPKSEHKNLPKVTEGWKVIKGYKALQEDMTSFFGNMTYKLGETYSIERPIVPCETGFHFCRELEELFRLYPPEQGRRFFEVEVEVRTRTIEREGTETYDFVPDCEDLLYEKANREYYTSQCFRNDFSSPPTSQNFEKYEHKYVGRKITLIRELEFEEFKDKVADPFIKTIEDYRSIKTCQDMVQVRRRDWLERTKGVLSEAFALFLFAQKFPCTYYSMHCASAIIKEYKKLVEVYSAFQDEPLSPDVRALILLNQLELTPLK